MIRVMIPLIGFLFFLLTDMQGNPIVVDTQRRPATMLSEKVMVSVGVDHSKVRGDFSFRQEADDWPGDRDTHVVIYVPVIMSCGLVEKYEQRHGTPVVIVKEKMFKAKIRNDLAFGDEPGQVKLPKDWFMQIYAAKIPLSFVSREFDIKIRYMQPNFPDGAVGYVPFLPPAKANGSKIVFQAPKGWILQRIGFFSWLDSKTHTIEFTPEDRKLIAVKLQKVKGTL